MTDIESLRALHEAATPGPWREGFGKEIIARNGPHPPEILSASTGDDEDWDVAYLDIKDADLALLIAMRNALPDLLNELDRLRGQVQRVEALAAEQCDCGDDTCVEWTYGEAIRAAIGGDDE